MPITETTRTEAAELAEYQCELVAPSGLRCAEQRGEMHHVIYRSHGGKDDLDNLIFICNRHHQLIHDGKLRRVGDGEQLRYSEDLGGRGEVDLAYWQVWRNVREQYEADFVALDAGADDYLAKMQEGAKGWVCVFHEIATRGLWQVEGWVDEHEYAASKGISRKAAQNHLRVADTYLVHVGIEPAALIESPATYTDLRAAASIARRLPPESVREHIESQPPGQLREALEDEAQEQETVRALEEGRARVRMQGTVLCQVEIEMDSAGGSREDAAEFRRRIAGQLPRSVVGKEWQGKVTRTEIKN